MLFSYPPPRGKSGPLPSGYSETSEYEYEIDAITGKILSVDWELDDFVVTRDTSNATTGEAISVERAKEIAITDAGISAKDAIFKKVELERDNGRLEYEVKFYAGSMEYEYEYEINAKTGSIISREMERID